MLKLLNDLIFVLKILNFLFFRKDEHLTILICKRIKLNGHSLEKPVGFSKLA